MKQNKKALSQKDLLIIAAVLFFIAFVMGIRFYLSRSPTTIEETSMESSSGTSSAQKSTKKSESPFSDELIKKNAKILDKRLEDHEESFRDMLKKKEVGQTLFSPMPE